MNNNSFWKLGKTKLSNNDFNGAFVDFAVGHIQSEAKSTFGVALMYYHGWAVEADTARAQDLFNSCFAELKTLANAGDGEAAFILYSCFDVLSEEKFIEPDDDEALYWLERAAELKDLDGCFWLANVYLCQTMLYVDFDTDYAIELLEYCVDNDMDEAMIELAEIYERCSYPNRARSLYKRASELGNEKAIKRLKENKED